MYNLLARKFSFFRALVVSLVLLLLLFSARYFGFLLSEINFLMILIPIIAFLFSYYFTLANKKTVEHALILFSISFFSIQLFELDTNEVYHSICYSLVVLLFNSNTNFKLKPHLICLVLVIHDFYLAGNILFTYASFAFALFTNPRLFIRLIVQYVIIYILAVQLNFLLGLQGIDFKKFIPVFNPNYFEIQEIVVTTLIIFWSLLFWLTNFKFIYSRTPDKTNIFLPFVLLIFVFLFVFFNDLQAERAWLLMLTISPMIAQIFDEIKIGWIKEVLIWLLLLSFIVILYRDIFDMPSFFLLVL